METTSDSRIFMTTPQETDDGRNRLAQNINTRSRLNDE